MLVAIRHRVFGSELTFSHRCEGCCRERWGSHSLADPQHRAGRGYLHTALLACVLLLLVGAFFIFHFIWIIMPRQQQLASYRFV